MQMNSLRHVSITKMTLTIYMEDLLSMLSLLWGVLSCDITEVSLAEIVTDDPKIINSFENDIRKWIVEE